MLADLSETNTQPLPFAVIDHAEKFVVTFPEDKRGRAVGLWAGVAGSGAMLGILLSGVLLTTWSWKSTFIVSAAAGLMLCVVSPAIPESRSTARERFDVLGRLSPHSPWAH